MTDDELVELVGRISNLYTKKSPPFALRDSRKALVGPFAGGDCCRRPRAGRTKAQKMVPLPIVYAPRQRTAK